MPLRKSYTGFVLWMILFIAGMFAVIFFPTEDEALLVRLLMNWMTLGVAGMALLIRLKQAVYWYNGTSFEDAVKAGEERRKRFAQRHFERFACLAGIYLIYSLLAQLYGLPFWIDIVLATVGLIVAAISTLRIKL